MSDAEKPAVLISLRGTEQYERFLDRLGKRIREDGGTLADDRSALAERALAHLGLGYGLHAPRRVPEGHGGKRAGAGRPKRAEADPPADPTA